MWWGHVAGTRGGAGARAGGAAPAPDAWQFLKMLQILNHLNRWTHC
jgi:hypothetical protein